MDKSIYRIIGASNHSDVEREINDYYATPIEATNILIQVEKFTNNIYEPAVGGGHIAQILEDNGYNIKASDIVDRGYKGTDIIDFLEYTPDEELDMDIVTNPPYKYAQQFVEKSMEVIKDGRKVAMLLKLTFLEGQKRKIMFDKYPPKTVHVFSKRVTCAMNGNFNKSKSSAVAYAWFVWEKGFNGNPIIKWI